jgi:hypothetical protein
MQPVSVICLFCEDIRQEQNGVNTLVGVLPDNMAFEKLPAVLPKLGIYVRINIDPAVDPGTMSLALSVPGIDDHIPIAEVEHRLIEAVRKDAQGQQAPIAGIISRAVFSPFNIPREGRMRALATIRGEPVTCGSLNIVLKGPGPSSVSSAA